MHDKAAIEELSKFSDDPDENVRKELADSLARLAPPDGDQILFRLLDDSDEDVRHHALGALDFVYPDIALPHFLTRALDGAYPDRLKIIELLAAYKDEQVAKVLVDLTGDPDDRIRQAAIDSLKQVSEKLEKSLRRFVAGRRFAVVLAIVRSVYRRTGLEAYMRL